MVLKQGARGGKDTDSRAHHVRGQRVSQGRYLGHLRALHHRLGRTLVALGILEAVEACSRASETDGRFCRKKARRAK